jgi:hypothetical protein
MRKQPTWTSLVLDQLERYTMQGEFRTMPQIAEELRAERNQISAALSLMRKYSAVDVVIQDGEGWWFATSKDDTRTKHISVRTPESKPRKRRTKK